MKLDDLNIIDFQYNEQPFASRDSLSFNLNTKRKGKIYSQNFTKMLYFTDNDSYCKTLFYGLKELLCELEEFLKRDILIILKPLSQSGHVKCVERKLTKNTWVSAKK